MKDALKFGCLSVSARNAHTIGQFRARSELHDFAYQCICSGARARVSHASIISRTSAFHRRAVSPVVVGHYLDFQSGAWWRSPQHAVWLPFRSCNLHRVPLPCAQRTDAPAFFSDIWLRHRQPPDRVPLVAPIKPSSTDKRWAAATRRPCEARRNLARQPHD